MLTHQARAHAALAEAILQAVQSAGVRWQDAVATGARYRQESEGWRAQVRSRDLEIARLEVREVQQEDQLATLASKLRLQSDRARTLRDALAEAQGSIRVVLRCRPLLTADLQQDRVTQDRAAEDRGKVGRTRAADAEQGRMSYVAVALRWLAGLYSGSVPPRAAAAVSSPALSPAAEAAAVPAPPGNPHLPDFAVLARCLGWRDDPAQLFRLLAPTAATASEGKSGRSGSSVVSGAAADAVNADALDVGPALLFTGSTLDDSKEGVLACPAVSLAEISRHLASRSGTARRATGDARPPPSALLELFLLSKIEAAVCRPSARGSAAVTAGAGSRQGANRIATSHYYFDRVYAPESTQEDVFKEVRPLLDAAFRGRNVTVLGYGPTGSGKTYTLVGPGFPSFRPQRQQLWAVERQRIHDVAAETEILPLYAGEDDEVAAALSRDLGADAGLLPRAVAYVFARMETINREQNKALSLYLSVCEAYNDVIRDLLTGASSASLTGACATPLPGTAAVTPMHLVRSISEAFSLLQFAFERRVSAATASNAESSRGHMITQLRVVSASAKGASSNGTSLTSSDAVLSTLQICDLAGSERTKESRVTGQAMLETCHVNASLAAVTACISALLKGSVHVPFRSNKLTRLLEPSLAGNSRVLVVLNASALPSHRSATVQTLRLGANMMGLPETGMGIVSSFSVVAGSTDATVGVASSANDAIIQSSLRRLLY